jgi:hypothetical protein
VTGGLHKMRFLICILHLIGYKGGDSGRAVLGVGIDRSHAGIMGSNPTRGDFLYCAVLC